MSIHVQPRPLPTRPRVSVVVPCYNYGRFLPECLDSILGQDGVAVDVLIVDDASPDGSAEVAHQLAAADARVRVLAQTANQGHITTYNNGLTAVDGDYVVLLSADDVLAPGALARAAALMELHPTVGLVYGFTRSFRDEPPPARTQVRSWTIWPGPEYVELICRTGTNPIMTPEVMMRTSTLRLLGGYDPRVPHAADFLLWVRAATRGAIGRVNGVDQGFYRVHGSNMHVSMFPGAVRDITERARALDLVFEEDREHLTDVDRLRSLGRRALAREALMIACQNLEAGEPREVSVELAALAHSIWPESRQSRAQRTYERHLAAVDNGELPTPVLPRGVTAFQRRVVNHLQYRYWRRTGVPTVKRSM